MRDGGLWLDGCELDPAFALDRAVGKAARRVSRVELVDDSEIVRAWVAVGVRRYRGVDDRHGRLLRTDGRRQPRVATASGIRY